VRAALVGAATKPLNLLVPAVLIAVAIIVQPWLVLAAPPVYAALVITTLRDPQQVDRLLGRSAGRAALGAGDAARAAERQIPLLPSDLRAPLLSALEHQQAILELLPTLPAGMADASLTEDLPRVVADMLRAAASARDIDAYLDTQDPRALERRIASARADGRADVAATLQENLDVVGNLGRTRAALSDRLASMASSLSIVHGRLVQAKASAQPVDVTDDVTELRDRARTLAEGVQEAFAGAPATTPGSPPAPA
jgi:hypothetical protein